MREVLMKIHLVQMCPEVNDKEVNLKKMLGYIDRALARDANLVIFAEMSLIGYNLNKTRFRELAETIPGPSVNEVAQKLKGNNCYVTFGMCEAAESYIYNAAPLIGPNGVVGVARKLYLADIESTLTGMVFAESARFKRGARISVFDTDFGKIGIQICGDLFHPEVAMTQALKGAWMIINLSAVPLLVNESGNYPPVYMAKAFENRVCWCYANLVGDQAGVRFHGGSHISLCTQGLQKQASQGKEGREEVIEYEIDKEVVYASRRLSHYLRDIRPELIEQLLQAAKKVQYGEE